MANNPNIGVPPPPLTTPLLTAASVESAEDPSTPKTDQDRGLLTMPWIMWFTNAYAAITAVVTPIVSAVQIALSLFLYPFSVPRPLNQRIGEDPSLKDFGAVGDVQVFEAGCALGTVASSATISATFSDGTGTIASVGPNITGSGTNFLVELALGQFIAASGQILQVNGIKDDSHATLVGAGFTPDVSGVAFTIGTGFLATDAGKKIVIYGAGNSGTPLTITGAAAGITTTNSYQEVCRVDGQAGTTINFALNCATAGVTFEVWGDTAANFSTEVLLSGPTAVAALAASSSFIQTPLTKRYYRIKAISTSAGVPGIGYGTISVYGYIFGTTILSVTDPQHAIMTSPALATRDLCYAYFGTDDTVAIQTAINVAYTIGNPQTADKGARLRAPAGKYLFSSQITVRPCVSILGDNAGATIFYADASIFPANIATWKITGTFFSDFIIAFFSHLQDIRIDCGHIPGSIGIYCDSMQEQSGFTRVAVINWLKVGVLGGQNTDRYGNANWMMMDVEVYPSVGAFLDDNVTGISLQFTVDLLGIKGSVFGQGGFICGYGKGIDISQGILRWYRLHVEAARIGIHFNTGSGGSIDGLDTQSFVQTALVNDGGNPIDVRTLQSSGAVAIQDNLAPWTITDPFVVHYSYTPNTLPARQAGPLQVGSDFTNPNIMTWNSTNFGPGAGMFLSVNSLITNFPNWAKSTQAASNKALFVRLDQAVFEVMIGAATNSNGVNPGVSYLRLDDVLAGIFTPRLYFDATGFGPLLFGNNLDVNWFRWFHGDTNQRHLKLQQSTNSGGTWTDVIVIDAVTGTITFTGAVIGAGINQLTGDVTAGPGSGSQAATLAASGVTASTYGDSTHVGQFTVDAKGRLTAASNVAISGGGGAVSSVFGRTGAVVAVSGDYTASQVTNAARTGLGVSFTVPLAKLTVGGSNGSLSFNVDGVLASFVNPT